MLGVRDGVFKIVEESLRHLGRGVRPRDAEMQRRWQLKCVQAPALFDQMVVDVVDVERLGAERDEEGWSAHHFELWDRTDAVYDRAGRLEDPLSDVEIALLAKAHHRSPCGGDDTARAAARESRREIDATRPRRKVEVLVLAETAVPVEQDRGPLQRIAVLVRVGRDGG